MDIAILRTFVEVMRRGSFASVARERNTDPSSISRAIATLEDDLKLRLFQRSTRRLIPTEAAQLYFERIEPLIEELERSRQQAIDASGHPKGTLRIASPVGFAQLNIVPLLPEFAVLHPELQFDLILTDAKLDLLEERIDIAVRLGEHNEKGMIAERLAPMIAHVCASPAYLKKHGHLNTPSDLEQHNCLWLNLPGFSDHWRFIDRHGLRQHVRVKGQLQTSNATVLKDCALAGLGVILQARWVVGRELRQGLLINLFPDHEVSANEFDNPAAWLLYPSRRYLPLKVRVFVDFLRSKFQHQTPWDTL
jgi:DNA-binding transcriptional LysR family regulator